jgi:hypothetical protein
MRAVPIRTARVPHNSSGLLRRASRGAERPECPRPQRNLQYRPVPGPGPPRPGFPTPGSAPDTGDGTPRHNQEGAS